LGKETNIDMKAVFILYERAVYSVLENKEDRGRSEHMANIKNQLSYFV